MSDVVFRGVGARPVVAVLTAPDEHLPPGLEALTGRAEVVHAADGDTLAAALVRADVLVVSDFRTSLLRETWPAAPSIKWVHATSAGVDAVLFPALADSDIPLTNARGIFDGAIAEFVLGQMLIFAKDFHTGFELKRRHEWRHRDTERLQGQAVLVVGAGSIGRRIAGLLTAAGMTVTGMARRRRTDPPFAAVLAAAELAAALPRADWVVIATPLTAATRGLFGAAEFRAMKSSARLINIARGPIVRTNDLVEALRSGQIAGAGLDVFEAEPLPAGHPLYELPNVVLSAHMAGDFVGWREALSAQFIENFDRWTQGKRLHNLVDKSQG